MEILADDPVKYAPKVDVIVVGAGLSGLVSAVKILQKERTLQVKILEATNMVGGCVEETPLGQVGGRWITTDQYHVHRMLQMWKIPVRRRVVLAPYLPRCWDIDKGLFGSLVRYELNRYIRELDLRMPQYRPGRYDRHKITPNMKRHIHNRLFFTKSRTFMEQLVQLITGISASDIKYSEFMSICSTCGGVRTFIDMYFDCPETLEEISSSKILQVLLDKLKYTEVLLGRKVCQVNQFRNHVEVTDTTFEVHMADAVILAVPWECVESINFFPPLPRELRGLTSFSDYKPRQLLTTTGYRKLMLTSFIARYTEGHWRSAGFSGNLLCTTPLIVGYEFRPTCYGGITMHEVDDTPKIEDFILSTLAENFGQRMLHPAEYYQRTYDLPPLPKIPLTTPWNRVIWSSSNSAASSYRGCISGAVQSGLRAAMNSMMVLRPQAVTWQDITEIQRYDDLGRDQTSWLSLFTSTWNLYNVSYYSLMVLGCVYVMQNMYARYSSK